MPKKKSSESKITKVSKEVSEEVFEEKPSHRKKYIFAFLGIIILGALLFLSKELFIAAIVNGEPIPRWTVIQELEKQNGQRTLSALITKTLISQEAKKQGVIISDKEIDEEIKKIDDSVTKQGQKLDQLLATQGLTKKDLREQIRVEKIIAKVLGKEITVTDKEVDEYIEKNKSSFPEDTDIPSEKENIKKQLEQQKMNEKFQNWLDALQKKSSIVNFVQY